MWFFQNSRWHCSIFSHHHNLSVRGTSSSETPQPPTFSLLILSHFICSSSLIIWFVMLLNFAISHSQSRIKSSCSFHHFFFYSNHLNRSFNPPTASRHSISRRLLQAFLLLDIRQHTLSFLQLRLDLAHPFLRRSHSQLTFRRLVFKTLFSFHFLQLLP